MWEGTFPVLPLLYLIDSKAIVDGNLKLILGLIWTLILHYSISMPMWDEEEDEEAKKQTPKQRLLGWIQNKLPQLPITNFSRDWQSGRALGALVDSCAPGEARRVRVIWIRWSVGDPEGSSVDLPAQSTTFLVSQACVLTGTPGMPVSLSTMHERPCSRLMTGWASLRYAPCLALWEAMGACLQ